MFNKTSKYHFPNPYSKVSNKLIVTSLLFSFILFAYALSLGSFIGFTVYPLIDRVTYSTPFVEKYIFSEYQDESLIGLAFIGWVMLSLKNNLKLYILVPYGCAFFINIFLIHSPFLSDLFFFISMPILFSLLIYSKFSNQISFFDKSVYLNSIGLFIIILSSIGLITTIISVLYPNYVLPSINYFYYIYLLMSSISPFLLVVVAFSFPLKVLIKKIFPKAPMTSLVHDSMTVKWRVIYLITIILFSIIIVMIPKLSTINIDNQVVGSDTTAYVSMLEPLIESNNLTQFFHESFVIQMSGDRPISLIIFYLFLNLVGHDDVINSIEYLPILLCPLLILSIYFLTLELTSNHRTSLLASLLSVASFQILIGTYAGFYANWMSLIFSYMSIVVLLRFLKTKSKQYLFLFVMFMILVLLTHAPTWTIMIVVVSIFLLINLRLQKGQRDKILSIFLALVPSIIIEISRLTFNKAAGVLTNISFATEQGLGIHDYSYIWHNLVYSSQLELAGVFGNTFIYILVIFWLFKSNLRDQTTILMLIFFSLSILPFLFGETVVQTRVLFEIPFQIPIAIALAYISRINGYFFSLALCFGLLTISIRFVSNFGFYP